MDKKSIKWILRYMDLAERVSAWSKDPSTKVGAIIVGDKGQIISQGYNGFPRGVKDTQERYDDRPLKYKLVVHAEMNAILNALYNSSSVKGCTLYVHALPICNECAKAIIQSGIKEVYMDLAINERWKESWELTKLMFEEAGIKYHFINTKPASDEGSMPETENTAGKMIKPAKTATKVSNIPTDNAVLFKF